MLSEFLRAALELGLPVAALSWLLFYRLYSRGELARDAGHKAIHANLKEIKNAQKVSDEPSDSLLHAKWMKFGGGFYGVAAAWTLLFIEASGIVDVMAHPSRVEQMFRNGPGDFLAKQIAGQVTTLVDASIWFAWWPGKGQGPLVWVAVAYVAYLAGLNLARYETGFGSQVVGLDSRARWRVLNPFHRSRSERSKKKAETSRAPP